MNDKKVYGDYFGHIIKEIWINNQLYIVTHDNIRDLWERKDLGNCSEFVLEPHSCKALKISL